MSIRDNIRAWLLGEQQTLALEANASSMALTTKEGLDLKLAVMASAVNYLAAGLDLADWRVYQNGKEVHDRLYWQLNSMPNVNQTKSEFCAKLAYKLCVDNEALIFSDGRGLFVADSWTVQPGGTGKDRYTNVHVNNAVYDWEFWSTDCIHIRMSWLGLWPILSSLADQYGELIASAIKGYERQTTEKGILNVDAVATGSPDEKKYFETLVTDYFKKYFDSNSSVLPLHKGYSYTPQTQTKRNTSEMNDVANLTDEFAERVAQALRIPAVLLKGNNENTSHACEDLVTFAVTPIARMVQQGFNYNHPAFGPDNLLKGSRLFIDCMPILLTTPSAVSAYCEKMTSCGQLSVDEGRTLRGESPLNTDESRAHWMTLNYSTLEGRKADADLTIQNAETASAGE